MTGDGEVVNGADRDFLAHYSARAPQVVSLARQWLRTTIFFVSILRLRIQNQTRIKHHIEIAPSINLFDDLFQKNLHRHRRAARTSNVTSSNGLSSSVIAPSRERFRPARFTERPARSTRRARPLAGEGERGVSGAGEEL